MLEDAREPCYTFFDCTKMDCYRRKQPSRPCWEIDDVRCKSHSPSFEKLRKKLNSKLEACKLCIYYKSRH